MITVKCALGDPPAGCYSSRRRERANYLRGYCQTYLPEEIREEQLVKQIDPFLRFLEVAASANAEIVNFSKIGRQCHVDHRAVLRYFQTLDDTLLGFFLEPYHTSVRKRQTMSPNCTSSIPGWRELLRDSYQSAFTPPPVNSESSLNTTSCLSA